MILSSTQPGAPHGDGRGRGRGPGWSGEPSTSSGAAVHSTLFCARKHRGHPIARRAALSHLRRKCSSCPVPGALVEGSVRALRAPGCRRVRPATTAGSCGRMRRNHGMHAGIAGGRPFPSVADPANVKRCHFVAASGAQVLRRGGTALPLGRLEAPSTTTARRPLPRSEADLHSQHRLAAPLSELQTR